MNHSATPAMYAGADHGLADSAYELINTDGETESQDDHATDSVCSDVDVLGRTHDTQSLASTDYVNDFDIFDGNQSQVDRSPDGISDRPLPPAIQYADDFLPSSSGHCSPLGNGHNISSTYDSSRTCHGTTSDKTELGPKIGEVDYWRFGITKYHELSAPTDCGFANDSAFGRIFRAVYIAAFVLLLPFLLFVLLDPFGDFKSAESAALVNVGAARLGNGATTMIEVPATITVTITSTRTAQPNAVQDLARNIAKGAEETAKAFESMWLPTILSTASRIWEDALSATDSVKSAGQVVCAYSGDGLGRLKHSLRDTAAGIRREAQDRMVAHVRGVEDFVADLSFTMLRAQIGSRLVWLKVRGDLAGYSQYKARASEFLGSKHRQLIDKRAPLETRASRGLWF